MPVLTGSETYCALLTGSPIPAPIILTCHDQVDADVFSEFTVGLDHVCLAVDNLEVLAAWQRHLNQHEVPYSFRRSEWGHHVNLRDPDTAPAGAGGHLQAASRGVGGRPQPTAGADRAGVLGVGAGAGPAQGDHPGAQETGQLVDVAVGLVVDETLLQSLMDFLTGGRFLRHAQVLAGWLAAPLSSRS